MRWMAMWTKVVEPKGGCVLAPLVALAASATMWRLFEGVV
jgi:hypothetical protein